MQVEDHPLPTLILRGTIPKESMAEALSWSGIGAHSSRWEGPGETTLKWEAALSPEWQQAQGEWYLVRLRDEKQWLLIRGEKTCGLSQKAR